MQGTIRKAGRGAYVVAAALAASGATQATVVMNSTRYVYSFVPLHSMGSERLHRDARRLDAALAERLAAEKMEAIVTDVDEAMHRHALAIGVRADGEGLRQSSVLPERELLEAQRSEEVAVGATHRLVIVPTRLTVDRATGVAHGVLRWRLEATGDATPVAVGLLRYTADARGYPARRMASALVTKLRSLSIR